MLAQFLVYPLPGFPFTYFSIQNWLQCCFASVWDPQKTQTGGSVPPMFSCAMSPVLLFHYHRSREHRCKSVSYPSLRWTAGHRISLLGLMRINSVTLWWQMLPKSQWLKRTKVYFSLVCHSWVRHGTAGSCPLHSRVQVDGTDSGTRLLSERREREQVDFVLASSTAHTLLTKEVKWIGREV